MFAQPSYRSEVTGNWRVRLTRQCEGWPAVTYFHVGRPTRSWGPIVRHRLARLHSLYPACAAPAAALYGREILHSRLFAVCDNKSCLLFQ